MRFVVTRPRGRVFAVVAAWGWTALVAGGGGGRNGDVPAAPAAADARLSIISGNGHTDTVAANLAQPLVVEAHDGSGALAAGRSVRFESTAVTSDARIGQPSLYYRGEQH